MSRKILTTSSSGLDNLNIRHNIDLIRLRVHINNVEFVDGKNIALDRLQYIMDEVGTESVRTSTAPAGEVMEQLNSLKEEGVEEVLIVTLSSQMSDSYRVISEVASYFKDTMKIHIYDSKELNICEAMLALDAEYLSKKGASIEEIIDHLDNLRASHTTYIAIEDLSYLIKNKKISTAAGFFANLLNIKPVIQVTDTGVAVPINKLRHFDRTLDYLLDETSDIVSRSNTFSYILSTGRVELDEYLKRLLIDRTSLKDIIVLPTSSISLANHGPTGVGIGFFEGNLPLMSKHFSHATYK